jgi:N-acetylmuramoyl-L-alanine amidase
MSISLRSVVTVAAALTASSVAPAQVTQEARPLSAPVSGVIPVPAVIELMNDEMIFPAEPADPLAPEAESEVATVEPVKPTGDLASLVAQLRGTDPGSRELECLAAGVYFEAKSEPLAGQLAVGEVIVNRATSKRFPSSYCGVLFQRGQFSFVRGKSYPSIPKASRQWQTAVAIAKIADQELHQSTVPDALFFHAKRVKPRWRLNRVGSVGNHIFYR